MNVKQVARFLSKVNKSTPNNCWEWTGSRTLQGYGMTGKRLGENLVHRVSFRLHLGPIFKGLCVLHRCDNPPCVNPKHLFLGTRDTNNKDRAIKGRTVIWNTLKEKCKKGHNFTEDNTYIRPSGARKCRECARLAAITYYRDKKI